MPAPTKVFRVELYHPVEGLICVVPFATLPQCQQLFEQLLFKEPNSAYYIQLRDYQEDMIESWPKEPDR